MKNFLIVILVLFLAVSCKKELIHEPKKLIERGKMVDIMYDLALLEAIKYNNPLSVDSNDTSTKRFVLQKYKVDSLQFAQSNIYYASNYETYKDMFDEISYRLEKEQKKADTLVKIEEKKKAAKESKKKKDSIKAASPAKPAVVKLTKEDSIRKVLTDSLRKRRGFGSKKK